MARGFPPRSAYLGSDLPPDELRMPAAAAGQLPANPAERMSRAGDIASEGTGLPTPGLDAGVPSDAGAGDEPDADDPSGGGGMPAGGEQGREPWADILSAVAQRAGVDPIVLYPDPSASQDELMADLQPIQDAIQSEDEQAAFDMMLEQYGLSGFGGSKAPVDPAAAQGRPRPPPLAAGPTFRSDRPGSQRPY